MTIFFKLRRISRMDEEEKDWWRCSVTIILIGFTDLFITAVIGHNSHLIHCYPTDLNHTFYKVSVAVVAGKMWEFFLRHGVQDEHRAGRSLAQVSTQHKFTLHIHVRVSD